MCVCVCVCVCVLCVCVCVVNTLSRGPTWKHHARSDSQPFITALRKARYSCSVRMFVCLCACVCDHKDIVEWLGVCI